MTVTTAKRPTKARLPLDQQKLTALQAERLSAASEVDAKDLIGLTTAEISEKFKFQIDPKLLLFRRVCGRVVKTDPITGMDHPVPFATVHVEDTDCSLLGYFPLGSHWAWYFPFRCRRETLATVKTDECGNFCAWIPRWDIDHVWRWRLRRFCFPLAFERPSLRDLLEKIQPIPKFPPIKGPIGPIGPDPVELPSLSPANLKRLEEQVGSAPVAALKRLSARMGFGNDSSALNAVLDRPAFAEQMAPPLPHEFRGARPRELAANAMEEDRTLVRDTLSERLQIDAADLEGFDLRQYIGPFKRCVDVLMPQWTTIVDVPDITFRVTQDIDGDGDEEVIYSENYFQVRWNAGPIGPVTLHANPSAVAGQLECLHHGVPCGTAPAIVMAGLLPVMGDPSLYDTTNGYVLRANRPRLDGVHHDAMPQPAATPFYGNVSLFGCNKTNATATHYRVMYKYSDNGGASFTAYQPMRGLAWWLYRLNAGTGVGEYRNIAPNADGWYPIAIPGDSPSNPFMPRDKLLDWPSNVFPDGRYVLKIELGNAGGTVLESSLQEVAFNIDNKGPKAELTVEWKRQAQGDSAFQPLTGPCAVVKRGVAKADLEFRVTLVASDKHMRSAHLNAYDCGQGSFSVGAGTDFHWHQNAADNTEVLQQRYTLDGATSSQGTYGFTGLVTGRAISPSGYDNGHLASPPWEYEPWDQHTYANFAFSVIDAD